MSVAMKMLGFALGLSAVFGLALGLGTLTGPVAQAQGQQAHGEADAHGEGDPGQGGAHGEGDSGAGMDGMEACPSPARSCLQANR